MEYGVGILPPGTCGRGQTTLPRIFTSCRSLVGSVYLLRDLGSLASAVVT